MLHVVSEIVDQNRMLCESNYHFIVGIWGSYRGHYEQGRPLGSNTL
jgi:hypothetical protein